MDGSIVLPDEVERLINRICSEKEKGPPDPDARRLLSDVGEEMAMDILCYILSSNTPIRTTFSRYIMWLGKNPQSPFRQGNSSPPAVRSPIPATPSPASSPLLQSYSPLRKALLSPSDASSPSPQNGGNSCSEDSKNHGRPVFLSPKTGSPKKPSQRPLFSSEPRINGRTMPHEISRQTLTLCRELEFRRFFLLRSYIGRNELADVISHDEVDDILKMKDIPIQLYESNIWETYGKQFCDPSHRVQVANWDSGKSHFYYCNVYKGGNYELKGPRLNTTRTHLQRSLGDQNVLIVKFVEEDQSYIERIFREGIIVGQWRYRFFVFKDERRDGKKKKKDGTKNDAACASVKSYFVRFDSVVESGDHESYPLSSLKVNEGRCLFMHAHKASSICKFMARFSLMLSKTIKLPIDLSSVNIERIQDVQCRDKDGGYIVDGDGEALILTDGTGFISEDLALMCPKDLGRAKFISDRDFQKFRNFFDNSTVPSEGNAAEALNKEPPLLIQCRLFNKGCAVKGTLLVNKKLQPGTIQIRPSMLKVERDAKLTVDGRFDSLEIVATSKRPRKSYLSKFLIALLNYGGVPRDVFVEFLTTVLEETRAVFSNKRAALNVAMNNEDIDDAASVIRMIFTGIPLNEPYLQLRLYEMAKSERNALKEGRIPINESFYLMGTTDPTGLLETNQVCVILDNGQISGKVLVYRNPGLHFGDIHILDAVYLKELEAFIGNAKYGIFFSTKGSRSVASEIANGDFDGDMYWISRNPQLLKDFCASSPWTRNASSPSAANRKPTDFTANELEHQLFLLFMESRNPSFNMSTAADSWLAFMDRLLTLGDDCAKEKVALTEKMLKLVDLYYDAVDAPKSGKKVYIHPQLRAERFPHYMGKTSSYNSTSILGEIHDKVQAFESEKPCVEDIWKLPAFDVEVPQKYVSSWKVRYIDYKKEMSAALRNEDDESQKLAANEVIKRYRQMLYEAAEFEESKKDIQEIHHEALAIYRVTYDYAIKNKDVVKCGFAWKVAGGALLHLGYNLLRDPRFNKGLAFTDKERDTHYLTGLLPPAIVPQELQEKKFMQGIRQYDQPLHKYQAMMELEERNERLFYRLLLDNVEELLPIVYTPTVGEACQKYGSIFKRPQGLFISLKEKGRILEVLKNWPERTIQVIVVTDGERILGLGDLGAQCLPITIDVGTNNEKLLNDEFYIGLKQRRATGKEYYDFLHEFMTAVKQNYGEKVLVQFEDFANHNAFELLTKYGTTHLVFNDDIQGTASVVLAGLVASLKVYGGTLADHTFLFLGAGEAGTGIAELIALEISKRSGIPVDEARKKIWLVDSKGLIVRSRKESLQHFKKPWAHEAEPVGNLLDSIKVVKPTILIGTSGVGKQFTQEVVEAMAAINEKPLIMALSNPTSQAECTAEEAYKWTEGRCIFASGSPFDPVEYNGKVHVPGQANNCYIFPGFGLGLVMSGAIRVHDDMLLAASEALANQVTDEHYAKGMIYPPFTNIRKISANIAAAVAAKAYDLGVATRLPRPADLVKFAESCMYTPNYRCYR
ncbi:OLC1v1025177C1 [Oldenlandia corymbosa var. corymbosa]|uniref:Malic enzyme n=1 Tax=Oldenlandia corymbosa var. corymbosa TaxID=529605 RepID=A0AAV1CZ21_OLDCO|nr:OLC1v1025177C1 [Oldenlandia corymbosa var. corymbosa]